MAKLTIVANTVAKADKIDFVKEELLKLIDVTRAEEGCVNYDLHQDNENPAHFMFYENWASRDAFLAHMNAPHLKSALATMESAIESLTLNEMTHIG